ncbi:hypothetical protein BABINDRAFT_159123 [Babjeviella inositovora NRRL Y-12698]|uniref:Uncharacterized protein n=1 Tax=Babjeviella inositovora NRRL Y-12698 TaxID=984486 RepID=A0A1E3QY14_9ASCO|nr:uncharacterized protein BABINDRAFT_159123 [Babjeviella inositovora NRRL Y-12698]ODQ82559.1 hypothetical protein BABINDRAFT_159123 [Babjeviella inositovora NRRL Y-12698]
MLRHITRSQALRFASAARFQSVGSATHFAPAPRSNVESNVLSETNRLEKTSKVFWKNAAVHHLPNNEGYEVRLDGKSIKSPMGFDMKIPANKPILAKLIAHEWQNLLTSPKTHSLPLTSVTSRAVDLTAAVASGDLEIMAKIGKIDDIKEDLLRYLDTDTLLVFSPAEEYEGRLRKAQEEIYRPIIKNMEEFFAHVAGVEKVELTYIDSDLHGLRGNFQPEATKAAVRVWMDKIGIWELVALEKATLSAKSFISGVAIVRANAGARSAGVTGVDPIEKQLTLEQVAEAATLETIYQTERWGEVEDTHDVDKVDIRRNLGTASLVAFNHL